MSLPKNIADWEPYWRELWAERAAIMEEMGHMSRRTAEREAEKDIRKLASRASLEA